MDEKLHVGTKSDSLQPYRDASYVLFSTRGSETLTGLNTLPITAISHKITELSASTDEKDWERAKAELLVLYRQLLTSPDLTHNQAMKYLNRTIKQAKTNRNNAKTIHDLQISNTSSSTEYGSLEQSIRDATSILDME